MSNQESKHTQTVKGTVVKISSNQTIRVISKVTKVHPVYKKRYTLNRYYMVHDANNSAKVGDEVTIVSCRPISKLKHWCIKDQPAVQVD